MTAVAFIAEKSVKERSELKKKLLYKEYYVFHDLKKYYEYELICLILDLYGYFLSRVNG